MVQRTALAFSCALLSMTARAFSGIHELPVRIDAGPLPTGLQTLERQTGIELLFDHAVVNGLQSPQVQGSLTTEAALHQLLADTNLTARRAKSGAWIVERSVTAPLAQQDAPVAEILVTGRRTQNTDIRRIENDVQPYAVVTRDEIIGAHRDNLEQYFASRVTANTQIVPPGLAQTGDPNAALDLRGLGSDNTVVLIDGRRMPRVRIPDRGFIQSDLSAVPLYAIERIEILTGAAGGIHGFGALGGVVNVVLDRTNRGLVVHATQGISSRGDAHQRRVEADFGRTFADGSTDFVLSAAHSESNPLLAGERGFATRERRRAAEILGLPSYWTYYPSGNSVTVRSIGPSLVFKPEFGGATVSSDYTFLPAGFSGDGAALASALASHAGRLDFNQSDDDADSYLTPQIRSDALLVNVRHRFRGDMEAYADAIVLRSRGSNQPLGPSFGGNAIIAPQSSANPFTDYISVQFPFSGMGAHTSRHNESTRYTAGVIMDLPLSWRGIAEGSWGTFSSSVVDSTVLPVHSFFSLFGDPSDPELNPLGDWQDLQRAVTLAADPSRSSSAEKTVNHFRAQSLRAAGPIFATAAGAATLTLLAEQRGENVPIATSTSTFVSNGATTTSRDVTNPNSSTARSLYTELRAPLPVSPLLRSLEVQLALRYDDERDHFARRAFGVKDGGTIRARFSGTAYTVGAKAHPTPWLMLRSSYATGRQPPPLLALRDEVPVTTDLPLATDPKRGSTSLGADGAYVLRSGGDPDLKMIRANTVFIGMELTPYGVDGPRFGLDYSQIRRKDDVSNLLFPDVLLAHEDLWPKRVIRAPLTDADRARGYAAGRVTFLDSRATNAAALRVNALDIRAEWPLNLLDGRLRVYADATYQILNRQTGLFQPDNERAGYWLGPLPWRANGGFDWSKDGWTLGANAQYFASYLVLQRGLQAALNDDYVLLQGARRIPAQAYLDFHATWRLPHRNFNPVDDLIVDFGLINVFDTSPPRVSALIDNGPGYSRYGDPRQRRVELVLSCRF